MPKCSNCESLSHNAKKCTEVCGHCGGNGHKRKECMKDNYTDDFLKERVNLYIKLYREEMALRVKYGVRFRFSNPPGDMSENIVKVILKNKGRNIVWCNGVGSALSGDLFEIDGNRIIEVKAFMSDGPSSFGPKKKFYQIYFLVLKKFFDEDPMIILWEVNLTNESEAWKSLKMNGEQSFEDKTGNGNRPHIAWENIKAQIEKSSPGAIKEVYNGSFAGIFTLLPTPPPATEPASEQST